MDDKLLDLLERLGKRTLLLTPQEALEKTILFGLTTSRRYGPGKAVERMPQEIRDALKELRPEHLQVRIK